jgi:hypothetical protein
MGLKTALDGFSAKQIAIVGGTFDRFLSLISSQPVVFFHLF